MDDLLIVQRVESYKDLNEISPYGVFLQEQLSLGALSELGVQVAASDVFHDDEEELVVF